MVNRTLRNVVEEILTNNPLSRNDDGIFFFIYLKQKGFNVPGNKEFIEALRELKTIERYRRFFQASGNFLPTPRIRKARIVEEQEYKREFA